MPTDKITSIYRLLGFSHDDSKMLLHDLQYEDCVFVKTSGYDPGLQEKVDDLVQGNVLEATVQGKDDTSKPWIFHEVARRSSTTLSFYPTEDFVPGPADETWENCPEDEKVAVNLLRDDDTGELKAEMQLYPEKTELEYEGSDGETKTRTLEIWEDIRRGLYPPEEWYRNLVGSDEGAHDVMVVNPKERPYVAILAFPESARDPFERTYRMLEAQLDDDDGGDDGGGGGGRRQRTVDSRV